MDDSRVIDAFHKPFPVTGPRVVIGRHTVYVNWRDPGSNVRLSPITLKVGILPQRSQFALLLYPFFETGQDGEFTSHSPAVFIF